MWLYWTEPEQTSTLKKFRTKLKDLEQRCGEVGISIACRETAHKVGTASDLAAKIHDIAGEQIRTRLAGSLMQGVGHAYVEEKNKDKARRLGETALLLSKSRMTPEANNMGYLSMVYGDLEEAKLWFQAAEQYDLEQSNRQLLSYNFGVLDALLGDIVAARAHFHRALSEKEESEIACVFKLTAVDGRFHYEETFDPPSIAVLVEGALKALDQVQ